MSEKEYKYNGRKWKPQPTVQDSNSFFHAAFGQGNPTLDKDANFRRKSLLSFIYHFESEKKPEILQKYLEDILESKEWEESYDLRYEPYIRNLVKSESEVLVKEIALIAALENTRIVVFVEEEEAPSIYHPEENLLGNYPWKVKNDLKEAVICFKEHHYSSLVETIADDVLLDSTKMNAADDSLTEEPSDDLSVVSTLETIGDSSTAETQNDQAFQAELTYPKLTGAAGIRGSLYQIDLLTIFLLNGTKKCGPFNLSTENKDAGKFDDVVLEIPAKSGFFLQAKHKQNTNVSHMELFSEDGDFSLYKYCLSYLNLRSMFNVQQVTLCTNTSLTIPRTCPYTVKGTLAVNDLLHYKDTKCCRYTFSEGTIPHLRNKLKNYAVEDEDMTDFFSKFQIVTNYPPKGNLDAVIEDILYQEGYCSQLETQNCTRYLNEKMIEWFEAKKGKYLTQKTLRIFLSEFRSNQFCDKLCSFHLHMRRGHFSYSKAKKLLHIESGKGYILNMIKVYYDLYVGGGKKYLFLGPNENSNIQMEMVRAFEDSSYVTLVACFKTADVVGWMDITTKLTEILRKYHYKRVILITGGNNRLAKLLKEMNAQDFEEIFENLTFNDLTRESQNRMLKRVAHSFYRFI